MLVTIDELKKNYKDKEALRGVSLSIRAGETVALIGPNGAGKTTTIECLLGLRKPMAAQSPCSERMPYATEARTG